MIVVGDDQQLPATVMSPLAEGLGYRRSLLQRLREGGCTVHMLQQQYRMHPDLAAFPSAHFYGGALQVCGGRTACLCRVYGTPLLTVCGTPECTRGDVTSAAG